MDEPKKIERILVRLPEGSVERIHRVLKGGELRSAFVRAAVEAELQRREFVEVTSQKPS